MLCISWGRRGEHLTGRAGQARREAKLSIHFYGICGLFTPLNVYPACPIYPACPVALKMVLGLNGFVFLFNWGGMFTPLNAFPYSTGEVVVNIPSG